MAKYRKKPIVIEAEQYLPSPTPFCRIPDGVSSYMMPDGSFGASIQTLEGKMLVSPGDYVITGVKGEKYPCKPDIFELTYEKVEDSEEK